MQIVVLPGHPGGAPVFYDRLFGGGEALEEEAQGIFLAGVRQVRVLVGDGQGVQSVLPASSL